MKTFSVWVCVVVVIVVALVLFGTVWLKNDASGKCRFCGLFSGATKTRVVEFVEIKNVVVTLKGQSNVERYLLLEVVLVIDKKENTPRVQEMSPLVRGATVSVLSGLDYEAVRTMSLESLRDQLMIAYRERFERLDSPVLFTEVIISKMVFQ